MAIRSVRLDEDSEKVLARLRRRTGMSTSALLRRGLAEYERVTREGLAERPYDIYARLNLGGGGWAIAPAKEATRAVRAARQLRFRDYVREKHRRRG